MADDMYRDDESSPPDPPPRDTFDDELARLKRHGCCLLLTGSVSERVRTAASQRLFGTVNRPRQRLLTLTDATAVEAAQYLPGNLTPDHQHVTVLNHTETARDGTAAADTSSPQPMPPAPTNPQDKPPMTGLGATIYDTVSTTMPSENLSPGELRVGLATLDPLIATDGLAATAAFIRALRRELRAVNGMGHVHFTDTPDHAFVAHLLPSIDIHLALREPHPHEPEFRWELVDANLVTDWLPI